jgi:uncharacterized protein (TIGR02466 family)
MEVHELFPTPVARFNLGRNISDLEKQTISNLSSQVHPNEGNVSTTDTFILDTKFPLIKEFIMECVYRYWDDVMCATDAEPYITQSWVNFTTQKGYHHPHTHANSIVSGVFYFNAKDDSIKFVKNHVYDQLRLNVAEFNTYNSTNWELPVKTGDLLIFPSSLPHLVSPVLNDHTRISLAFNVFAQGRFGIPSNLEYVKLDKPKNLS